MDVLKENGGDSSEALKMAIAMALFKSKLLRNQTECGGVTNTVNDNGTVGVSSLNADDPPPPPPPSSSSRFQSDDALKWKRKAKERKREILRLQEDLKVAEDGLTYDVFPQNASCKCYFFDNMAELSTSQLDNNSDCRFNDVLRRRFFRHVRIQERRKRRNGTTTGQHILRTGTGTNSGDEFEQLSASVDFLVEICETISLVSIEDVKFKNWSHQAVDFILISLKNLLPMGCNVEPVEGVVNNLIVRLLKRMCYASSGNETDDLDTPVQFYIQHLIRKLGSEPYVGQRVILSVSLRISVAAESLLFMNPFDDAFPNLHCCMYVMIQLIEFLVSDCLSNWLTREDFDVVLLEEWIASILHARKGLELLENRNGLYVLYIDRLIGDVAKRVGQSSFSQKLNKEVRSSLFS